MTNSHSTSLIEEIKGESTEDHDRRLFEAIQTIAATPPNIMEIFQKIIATPYVDRDVRQDFIGLKLKNTIRPKLMTAGEIQQATLPRPRD